MDIQFDDFDFRLYIYAFGNTFHKTYFSSEYGSLLKFWKENDSIISHVSVTRFNRFVCCIESLEELKEFPTHYKHYLFFDFEEFEEFKNV